MSHVGIITPPVPGHIHPFGALGRALQKRGHRVTLFHMADLEAKVRAEGLDFRALGACDHPLGSLPESLQELSRRKGLSALRFTIQAIRRTTEMICRDGPSAIEESAIDLLLVDQMEPAGGTVAEHLGIPFITVCNALAINRESRVPPSFTGWNFHSSLWARIRNQVGYAACDRITRPIQNVLDHYRHQWSLSKQRNEADACSALAQLSQQSRLFDFPRRELPASFHYLGPFRDASPQSIPFPWDRLNGKPLIYASLGTLQNRSVTLFKTIAEACRSLPVQLVISHARGLTDEEVSGLPGSPLVVPYAPQQALLAKARLTVTHAGLNTVLDSLSQGVPLVAIPLTFEQPAIAARIRWTGTGDFIPFSRFTAQVLREKIQDVMSSEAPYAKAAALAACMRTEGGVERAADLIESALKK